MLVRYNAPTFVPNSTNAIYNNQDISYTTQQANYLNWIKTVLENSGMFTNVEITTDPTTEDRLLPDTGNDDNGWYVPGGSTSDDTDLLKTYTYYVDCYVGENKFLSIYVRTYKYLTNVSRTIDGTTCYRINVGDLVGFIVKPKNIDTPSYHAVVEPTASSSSTSGIVIPSENVLTYSGILDFTTTQVISSNGASHLVEIVQTDDAMFFRFVSMDVSSEYGALCIAKTFKGSIAAITAYSSYYGVSNKHYSNLLYPSLYCVSNDSVNYGIIRSIPMFNVIEGSTTILSYIPVSSSDDYVIGTYFSPLSQIQFDNTGNACSIRLAGNKYFYTGFFAAPYK